MTLNVAVWPAVAVLLDGWLEIAGAVTATFTVSTAPVLVTEPALFVTTTVYVPALAADTDASVSVELVAPEIAAPSFLH